MAFKLAQSSFETKGIFLQTNLPGSGEGRAGSCHYPLAAKGGLLRSFSQKPSLRCLNCCSSSPSSPWCLLSLCSSHHTWEWISHFPSPQLSCGRRVFLPFFDEGKGGAIAQPLLPRMGCGMWGVGCCPHKPLVSCWRTQPRDQLRGTADPGGSGCGEGALVWSPGSVRGMMPTPHLSSLAELLVSSASAPVKLGQKSEGFFRCCSFNL